MQQKKPVPCTEGGSFHDWDDGVIAQKPNCKEKGRKVYTCLDCQKTKEEAIAQTMDHTYGDWTVKKEATCTEKGKQASTCTVCGKAKTKTVKALGHDYEKAVTVKEATIYSAGVTEKTCSRCQKVKKTKTLCTYRDKIFGIMLTTKVRVFPKNTEIQITSIEETDVLQAVTGKAAAFDIAALVKQEQVAPKGKVTLEIKIPEGFGTNLALYRITEEKVQKLESEVTEKLVRLEIETLGRFALCDLDVPYQPPVEETTEATTQDTTEATTAPATMQAATETATVAAPQKQAENISENDYILLIAVGFTVLFAGCMAAFGIREMKKRKAQKEETPT